MRVVALVSGGKDSCYNMIQCVAEGHEIVALANLHPKDRDELDSYMYQTVGHMGIEVLAKAMGLPLYRQETKGRSTQIGKHYVPTDDDEVEDLYSLLETCKNELNVDAVAVGAILSDYQRVRVENVCSRLSLTSLAYLWRREQTELLQEMIDCQVHAIVIKVAALGLVPDRHLGKSLREMQPHLLKMRDKYGLNVCGEGGEYETFTIDCPLFKQRIKIEEIQTIISSADPVCPVGYINFTKLSLQAKETTAQNIDVGGFVKKSIDYLHDLNESTYSDLSDPDLSETELELIEKQTRIRESLSQNELITRSDSFGRRVLTTPTSPIPIVMKSSSAEDASPSSPLQSVSMHAISSTASSQLTATDRQLATSTIAVCGSNDLSNASTIPLIAPGATAVELPPLTPFQYQREIRPIANRLMVAVNQKGWMWIAGVQGCATTLEAGMHLALQQLKDETLSHNYELTDFCYITLYVRSMADYPQLNAIYGEMFSFYNPPTRVCVECPLPDECQVIIEAVAHSAPARTLAKRNSQPVAIVDVVSQEANNNDSTKRKRQSPPPPASKQKSRGEPYYTSRYTMHVQGISHWAPANIGPYSQSTRIGDITYISGQIALVPGSMTLIEGGIRPQCKLALRHISRIAKAMDAHGQLRDVVQGLCFVTHPAYIGEARRQWERCSANAIMDYIVLPALPRGALVEWQVWAHAHNDRFEYEETGCSVGEYTISIRRRWNYDNNCAAIVCYVSTGPAISNSQLTQPTDEMLHNHTANAQNINAGQLDDILTYIANRLLKDCSTSSSTTTRKPSRADVDKLDLDLASSDNSSTQEQQQQQAPQQRDKNDLLPLPAIHFKVFYQVASVPNVDLLLQALHDFKLKRQDTANIVYTVLPACSLHNFNTFVSICGVRHE